MERNYLLGGVFDRPRAEGGTGRNRTGVGTEGIGAGCWPHRGSLGAHAVAARPAEPMIGVAWYHMLRFWFELRCMPGLSAVNSGVMTSCDREAS